MLYQKTAALDNEELQVDDTDGLHEEEEYQAWCLRELSRLKRDKLAAQQRALEIAEKEKRQAMTDEEIQAELEATQDASQKSKLKFLQRYYHKGAFFTDDENVKQVFESHDFSQPTLEDKFNREVLPEVMQVKNFGKAGRTKYTHLLDQDTSRVSWGVSKPFLSRIQKMISYIFTDIYREMQDGLRPQRSRTRSCPEWVDSPKSLRFLRLP